MVAGSGGEVQKGAQSTIIALGAHIRMPVAVSTA